jgi:HSP20 family protein
MMIQARTSFNSAVRAPHADVCETDDAFYIDFDVPGISDNDLRLRFEPGALTLEGVRTRRPPENCARCIEVEIEYGTFMRRVILPRSCDEANIEAHLEQGVLRVRVPKTSATQQRINIK